MNNFCTEKPIVLAVVGHVDPIFLKEVHEYLENIPNFRLVFFKTSHGKLFIVEGEKQ